jgi:hypothetical protein
MNTWCRNTRLLHTETDDSFKKYRNFLRPAKYLVPVAIFALLMGSCDPDAPGADDPTDPADDPPTDPVDPATIIDAPSFADPVALNISWSSSGGNYSIFHPALADMDGDGDLDIITGYKVTIGSISGFDRQGLVYLKNTTTTSIEFTHNTTDLTGLPQDQIYSWLGSAIGAMIPAVNDIDGDTDLDIVASRNFFSSSSGFSRTAVKMYIAKNNANNFSSSLAVSTFGNFSSSSSFSSVHRAAALVNLDGDSDIDIVAGGANISYYYSSSITSSTEEKGVYFIANEGPGNFFSYSTEQLTVPAPETITDVKDLPIPSFADVDNDGDQDMFTVTYSTGAVTFYLNTGTATVPVFEAQTSAFSVLPTDTKYFPAFGDMDGDTDLDVIAGTSDGRLLYIENTDIE